MSCSSPVRMVCQPSADSAASRTRPDSLSTCATTRTSALHALTEVPLEFRAYYRVDLSVRAAGSVVAEDASTTDEAALHAAPIAVAPSAVTPAPLAPPVPARPFPAGRHPHPVSSYPVRGRWPVTWVPKRQPTPATTRPTGRHGSTERSASSPHSRSPQSASAPAPPTLPSGRPTPRSVGCGHASWAVPAGAHAAAGEPADARPGRRRGLAAGPVRRTEPRPDVRHVGCGGRPAVDRDHWARDLSGDRPPELDHRRGVRSRQVAGPGQRRARLAGLAACRRTA